VCDINKKSIIPMYNSLNFKKTLNNVISIKIISSEIPNIILKDIFINNTNNNFYWENLMDNECYNITIPHGNYTYCELAVIMQNLIKKVKRNINKYYINIYDYNEMDINFNKNLNLFEFISYNIFILPKCIFKIVNCDENDCIITIEHKNHNLSIGDIIYIDNAIDHEFLKSDYINSINGHVITNIINDKYYEIKIYNINKINQTLHTCGGCEIKLKTRISFRLLFNKNNTIGQIIGFKNIGNASSITLFSNQLNNYVIKNTESYIGNIDNLYINKDFNKCNNEYLECNNEYLECNRYILLLCNNFNHCINTNDINYFYKFQLNDNNCNTLYNTYVNTPITINPPLNKLSKLEFKFIYPDGSDYIFYNQNYSFTIEITTVNNYPENTLLNPLVAKI
jgi:hypothetical protein